MLPSPLPSWIRHRIIEVIAAYRLTIQLCEDRCNELRAAGWPGDDYGSINEYRMDGKYCAGMATRTPLLLADSLTTEEQAAIFGILKGETVVDPNQPMNLDQYVREMHQLERGPEHWREIAVEPQKLAPWAWERPLKPAEPVPEPAEAVPDWRLTELMQPLSQREAEALILVKVCLLSEAKSAEIMGCTEDHVKKLVYRAKKRLTDSPMIHK